MKYHEWIISNHKRATKPELLRFYGISIRYNEDMPTSIKQRWILTIYFGKKYRQYSNYPLKDL